MDGPTPPNNASTDLSELKIVGEDAVQHQETAQRGSVNPKQLTAELRLANWPRVAKLVKHGKTYAKFIGPGFMIAVAYSEFSFSLSSLAVVSVPPNFYCDPKRL